jgi:hypothetical protein
MLKLVPAGEPIVATALSRTEAGELRLAWEGGAGPFVIQQRARFGDGDWSNVKFSTVRTETVPQNDVTTYLRVMDVSHLPPIPFSVYLTGAGQNPTNDSSALGTGLLRLDGNTLSFDVSYGGLRSVATAGHIHGPTNTSGNAGVLINLAAYNGGRWGTDGTLSGVTTLTDAQKAVLLGGQAYINLHNQDFMEGEIRGQILPVHFAASLSGADERPNPVMTPGRGSAHFTLVGNQLTFNLTYAGLRSPATAAHIHGPTNATGNADVLIGLDPFNSGAFGTAGTLSGSVTLTPQQIRWVADGLTYVNFHTTNSPGGEIRGQIRPRSTAVPLTALLSGLAEHPPLTTEAFGSGTFGIEGDTLSFGIVYGGLSGPATAAHIHGYTNTTGDAGVLIDLSPFNAGAFGEEGSVSGSILITPAQRDGLLRGLTYVNFHTENNGPGELRGQIAPVIMTSSLSGGNEQPDAVASPGHGSGTFALVRDQLALQVTYRDLPSPATASHLHGVAGRLESAGVLVNLEPFNGGSYGASGSLAGVTTLNYTNLLTVIDEMTYVNLHTTNHTGGEIRGQVAR